MSPEDLLTPDPRTLPEDEEFLTKWHHHHHQQQPSKQQCEHLARWDFAYKRMSRDWVLCQWLTKDTIGTALQEPWMSTENNEGCISLPYVLLVNENTTSSNEILIHQFHEKSKLTLKKTASDREDTESLLSPCLRCLTWYQRCQLSLVVLENQLTYSPSKQDHLSWGSAYRESHPKLGWQGVCVRKDSEDDGIWHRVEVDICICSPYTEVLHSQVNYSEKIPRIPS